MKKLSEILKEAGAPQDQIDLALKNEADLNTANTEAKDRRINLKKAQDDLKKFDGVDVDKYKEAEKTLALLEEEKQTKAGDFDKVKATLIENHGKAMKEITTGRDDWKNKYEKLAIDNTILSTAVKGKAIKPEDIAALVRSNIKMDEEGGITIEKDGKPLIDNAGKNVTIDSYVTGYLGENPQYVQGTGGGGGSRGGSGGGKDEDLRGQSKISAGLKKKQDQA
jgi:predicted house-cleaning NTP pyrophosphatase (Maf/HAM1 superfamily)